MRRGASSWLTQRNLLWVWVILVAGYFTIDLLISVWPRSPRCLQNNYLPNVTTIAVWNAPVVGLFINPKAFEFCPTLRGHCIILDNEEDWDRSDAIFFSGPRIMEKRWPARRCPRQLWIIHSLEHDIYYPELAAPHFWDNFNISITYRMDSSVTQTYFGLTPATLHPIQPKDSVVAFVASNCKDFARRLEYIVELMKTMRVDSYGECLRNIEDPEVMAGGYDGKLKVLARHKFYLAFENALLQDYVTEKFFHALSVGTVPVYRGAPNVADFAPHPHSYIDASFYTPQELAEYLMYLDRNETAYNEYHAWRAIETEESWVNPNWNRLYAQQMRLGGPMCQACDLLLKAKRRAWAPPPPAIN